jgi:hypothetical protein
MAKVQNTLLLRATAVPMLLSNFAADAATCGFSPRRRAGLIASGCGAKVRSSEDAARTSRSQGFFEDSFGAFLSAFLASAFPMPATMTALSFIQIIGQPTSQVDEHGLSSAIA